MPPFPLLLLVFRNFRAVSDEVPILVAASALEGELFIVQFLNVGLVPHREVYSFGQSGF